MPPTDRDYITHIHESTLLAQSFVTGLEKDDLYSNDMLALALTRLLEIIGEAANNLSPQLRESHPEIPWGSMIGARNRLIHGYFSVDLNVIWDIVIHDLPLLEPALQDILKTLDDDKWLPQYE